MPGRSLLVAGALWAAGCAVGQSDADARAVYVDAAASAFTSGRGGPPLPSDVATCVGEALVDVPGTAALRAADVDGQDLADAPDLRSLGAELPDDAVDRLASDLGDCRLAEAIERPLLEAFAQESGGRLSGGAATCVVEAADDRAVERGLAETFVDRSVGTPGFDALLAGLADCPDATVELLVNGLGQETGEAPPPAVRECVESAVRLDPKGVADSLAGPAAEALVTALLAECLAPFDVRA